jgi:hypothetical protein
LSRKISFSGQITGYILYFPYPVWGEEAIAPLWLKDTMHINKISGRLKVSAGIDGRVRIPAIILLALLILSCPTGVGKGEEEGTTVEKETGVVLDTRFFWAVNVSTGTYYQTRADLLAEGRYCKIWVERDSRKLVDSAAARKMADVYDDTIYPRMMDIFGMQLMAKDANDLVMIKNTMEWADYLTDGDGKLSILLLDIKDGYNPPTNNSYTSGYFSSINFFQPNSSNESRYSNQIDMIYVDTSPSTPGERDFNAILAHEMQHLMNFITSVLVRWDNNTIHLMDLWINEGLSSAAEYIFLEDHGYLPTWFNTDQKGTIAKGNNFFVWGNLEDDSIMDDYATVYLFFQWLRLQSGGTEIYNNIIRSLYSDYHAVTSAVDKAMSGKGYANWDTLLKTWMAANYINASSGPYGYRNDSVLKNVRAKTAPSGTTVLRLLPGEGVYSKTTAKDTIAKFSPSGLNIKYAGLNRAGMGAINDSATYVGGALLTYNANTNREGIKEIGWLTGIADEQEARLDGSGSRSITGTVWEGPIRIDARDMLARNGHPAEGEGFDPDLFPLGDWVLTGEARRE